MIAAKLSEQSYSYTDPGAVNINSLPTLLRNVADAGTGALHSFD